MPVHQQKARKVELRPGPVKAQATSSVGSRNPGSSKLSGASTNRVPKDVATPAASDSPPSEGIISTAKHDVEEATQHGILTPPPPNASTMRRLFHQAKELFKFYYRGLKLINTNRKRAKEMQQRVKNGGPPLTRWENRFIRTTYEDLVKLVPFALIILVAEEVIPLVVMYAPFILPSTCILPAQKERIDNKRRDKQRAYATSMRDEFKHVRTLGESSASGDAINLLDGPGLAAFSGILGHSDYSVDVLRRRKIRKHLTAVAADDALLIREGAGSRLTATEVVEALGERGIITEGRTLQQQRTRLHWWLTEVQKPSPPAPDQSDPITRRLILIARGVSGGH
ncbi:LETM1-like protein-domain-containing protein [Cytidiella melzeri]|nr:LETM1-like protein-domain-containing protein [Cytidiella melzeri]